MRINDFVHQKNVTVYQQIFFAKCVIDDLTTENSVLFQFISYAYIQILLA